MILDEKAWMAGQVEGVSHETTGSAVVSTTSQTNWEEARPVSSFLLKNQLDCKHRCKEYKNITLLYIVQVLVTLEKFYLSTIKSTGMKIKLGTSEK